MRQIGRKIYIDWGDKVLAIEKIIKTEENLRLLGIEDIQNRFANSTEAIILYDIFDMQGVRMEKRVGPSSNQGGGYEFQYYLVNNGYWATDEEFVELTKQRHKEKTAELGLKKEFDCFPGTVITDNEEYKAVHDNGVTVRIHLSDETFWGVLFDSDSLSKYKNGECGATIKFMAANTTFNGQICGGIYEGYITSDCCISMHLPEEDEEDE